MDDEAYQKWQDEYYSECFERVTKQYFIMVEALEKIRKLNDNDSMTRARLLAANALIDCEQLRS